MTAEGAPVQSVRCNRPNASAKCYDCEIASDGEVADCKSRYSREKVAEFDTLEGSASHKEKKNFGATLNLSHLFRGTMFASAYYCADNLLPRDPAPVPKPRPGYLNRRIPTAVPTRSPAVLFSPINLRTDFTAPAFSPRDFCYSDRIDCAVWAGGSITHLRRYVGASMLAVFAAAVSVGISGCWMAAAQFAPLAANIAETVG